MGVAEELRWSCLLVFQVTSGPNVVLLSCHGYVCGCCSGSPVAASTARRGFRSSKSFLCLSDRWIPKRAKVKLFVSIQVTCCHLHSVLVFLPLQPSRRHQNFKENLVAALLATACYARRVSRPSRCRRLMASFRVRRVSSRRLRRAQAKPSLEFPLIQSKLRHSSNIKRREF